MTDSVQTTTITQNNIPRKEILVKSGTMQMSINDSTYSIVCGEVIQTGSITEKDTSSYTFENVAKTVAQYADAAWILFLVIVLIMLLVRFWKKIPELLDILIDKIKNSTSGSFSLAGFGINWLEGTANRLEKEDVKNIESDELESYISILKDHTACKIVSTLWFYQQRYGKKDDNITRWGFIELADRKFESSAAKLSMSGLVYFHGPMVMLTDMGIRFCQAYNDKLIQVETDLYQSFRK